MHFRHSAKEGTGSSHRIQVNLLRKKFHKRFCRKQGNAGGRKQEEGVILKWVSVQFQMRLPHKLLALSLLYH